MSKSTLIPSGGDRKLTGVQFPPAPSNILKYVTVLYVSKATLAHFTELMNYTVNKFYKRKGIVWIIEEEFYMKSVKEI